MPTHEYQIWVGDKIVNREYSSKKHESMVKIFEEHGKEFKIRIKPLLKN